MRGGLVGRRTIRHGRSRGPGTATVASGESDTARSIEAVRPAPDDWRRMGQESYLAGLAFTWRSYQTYTGNWEHDHCEFCWKKFLDPGYSDWMREALADPAAENADAGYTNVRAGEKPSGTHWVCRECFGDFQPEFGWEVVDSDPTAWPYDTAEPNPRPTAADFEPRS